MLEEVGFFVDFGGGVCASVKWLDIRVTVCLFLRQATGFYAHNPFGIRRRFDIYCCETASISADFKTFYLNVSDACLIMGA